MLGSVAKRWKHYVLTYKYVNDMANKRGPYREHHLAHAQRYESKGLLLGGALQNPIDSAILLFEGEESVLKEFVANDPYVKNGLIPSHEIREIMLVVGSAKPK